MNIKLLQSNKYIKKYILFVCIFMLIFIFKFIPLADIIVPPGGDSAVHLDYINYFSDTENYSLLYRYVPGFHLFLTALHKITNVDTLVLIKISSSALIPLISLALYCFIKNNFNFLAACFASILFVSIAKQPLQTIGDGGLPNVLAADFLTIIALFLLFKRKYFASIIFIISICFTHHISFIYTLILYFPIFFILLYKDYKKNKNIKKAIFLPIILIIGVTIIYVPFASVYNRFFIPFFVNFGEITNIFSSSSKNISQVEIAKQEQGIDSGNIIPIENYLDFLFQENFIPIFIFSIIFLIIFLIAKKIKINIFLIFIFYWFIIFFVISRSTLVFFPERFARESAIPLIILFGCGFSLLYNFFKNNKLLQFFMIATLIIPTIQNINLNPYAINVFTQADLKAIKWLNKNINNDLYILSNGNKQYTIFQNNFINKNIRIYSPYKDEVFTGIENKVNKNINLYQKDSQIAYIYITNEYFLKPELSKIINFNDFEQIKTFKNKDRIIKIYKKK